MKHGLTLLSVSVIALHAWASAQEAKQPAALTLHLRLTKDGLSIESTSTPVDPNATPADGEMWIECREIKVSSSAAAEAVIECRGEIKVRGRCRRDFEARAELMIIAGAGKCLEFRGAGSRNVDLWMADADGTSRKHLTDRHITWRIANKSDDDDLGFFHDYSDDGAARKPIALPPFQRSK